VEYRTRLSWGYSKWWTRIVQAADRLDRVSGIASPSFLELPVWYFVQAIYLITSGGNMQLTEKHKEYWQKNLRMTGMLLALWFIVTFVIGYFARDLQSITILGFPFPFYMGAQGSLAIYVAIIWYYAHYMNKLDQEYGVHEGDD
jgi:putative solute:sodium symporter small subunit